MLQNAFNADFHLFDLKHDGRKHYESEIFKENLNSILNHTLLQIRKPVQDFTEVQFETQIGALGLGLCRFNTVLELTVSHTCAYLDILHWEKGISVCQMMLSLDLDKPG